MVVNLKQRLVWREGPERSSNLVLSVYVVVFPIKYLLSMCTCTEKLLLVLHSQSTVDNVTICIIYLTLVFFLWNFNFGSSNTAYILSNHREMLVLDLPCWSRVDSS